MAEVDRAGNSDNFNFNSHQVCKKHSQAMRKKDEMFARCWFCYISIAKFWVLDYQYVL